MNGNRCELKSYQAEVFRPTGHHSPQICQRRRGGGREGRAHCVGLCVCQRHKLALVHMGHVSIALLHTCATPIYLILIFTEAGKLGLALKEGSIKFPIF